MESSPHAGVTEHGRRPKYTWDDFLALPDDDKRELFDGDLIEVDVPTLHHEYVVGKVLSCLDTWVSGHGGGLVLPSSFKLQISEDQGVMPDVQLYRAENPLTLKPSDEQRARPDVAVEVISTTSRKYDQTTKLEWYAEIGVPEYWLIDPEARTLLQYVLKSGQYALTTALRDEAVFKPASLPGLEIPLSSLWEMGSRPGGPAVRK
jgi:Uma2 family endonuclease